MLLMPIFSYYSLHDSTKTTQVTLIARQPKHSVLITQNDIPSLLEPNFIQLRSSVRLERGLVIPQVIISSSAASLAFMAGATLTNPIHMTLLHIRIGYDPHTTYNPQLRYPKTHQGIGQQAPINIEVKSMSMITG